MAAFDTRRYRNRLGVDALAHTRQDLDDVLRPLGWTPHAWFGVRVLSDHLDAPAPEGPDRDALVAAEERAGRTDPYRGVAALLHVVHRRAET